MITMYPYICPTCGNEFQSRKPNRKFCRQTCKRLTSDAKARISASQTGNTYCLGRRLSATTKARMSARMMGNIRRKRQVEVWHCGYCWVDSPAGHPRINHHHNGRIKRCNAVMEAHLGRYLEPGEIIHHRDGDKTNDAIENLEVMFNGDHSGFHSHQRGIRRSQNV